MYDYSKQTFGTKKDKDSLQKEIDEVADSKPQGLEEKGKEAIQNKPKKITRFDILKERAARLAKTGSRLIESQKRTATSTFRKELNKPQGKFKLKRAKKPTERFSDVLKKGTGVGQTQAVILINNQPRGQTQSPYGIVDMFKQSNTIRRDRMGGSIVDANAPIFSGMKFNQNQGGVIGMFNIKGDHITGLKGAKKYKSGFSLLKRRR